MTYLLTTTSPYPECHDTCVSCTEGSQHHCIQCKPGLLWRDGQCVARCGSSFYQDGGQCRGKLLQIHRQSYKYSSKNIESISIRMKAVTTQQYNFCDDKDQFDFFDNNQKGEMQIKECLNYCFSSHYYYKEYFSYSQPVMGLAQSVSVQMKTVVCHVLFLVSYLCLGGA